MPTKSDASVQLSLHARAVDLSVDAVSPVRADQLEYATPCVAWNLRELLRHMTVQNLGFAAAVEGNGADPAIWQLRDFDDPVSTYLAASERVIDAFAGEGALTRECVLLEFSAEQTFPGAALLRFHLVDSVVHAWDVARSIGNTITVDDELAAATLQIAETVPDDDMRLAPGAPFAPGLVGASTSTLDRILLGLGRSPSWQH
ncbi:TIGR03086 family metal-binding protein [Antrihabitans spumae]|uniref:TIGR03086 family metal-binding protein n=1 Tax=Antrihabitans spumae TaxID=3373370 RepID=A0ABW7KUD4_9NOCA